MRSRVLSFAIALVSSAMPAVVMAADCPSEVKDARQLLTTKTATAKKVAAVPRSQAGARGQETQAPRGQEQQAPRQDIQAPRGQETQAPRGQEQQAPRQQATQAPRQQDIQAPRNVATGRTTALTNARRLVDEAEAACRDADMDRAASNARAAIDLLSYLP